MPNTNLHTLNTRIKLKYDSYEKWVEKDPILLAGEVAIATVSSNDAEGKPGFQNLPNIVFKVGDGVHPYTELKFVSALAADVHSWAKEATKPVYTAQEIDGIQDYIDNIIAGTEGIHDTDTKYQMRADAENAYTFHLYSTDKDGKNEALVYTLNLSDIDSRLDTVEAALGTDGSVAKAIANAIDALDVAETTLGETEMYFGYSQANGLVTLTKRELGIANVAGLQAALNAKQDDLVFETAYDPETNKVATMANVTSAIDALDKADAAVAKQFVTAVSEENGIITVSRRGLETADFGTGDAAILPIDAVIDLPEKLDEKQDNLVFAGEYNPETNKVALESTVISAVADLNGAMHFEGVVESDPTKWENKNPDGVYAAGDVVLCGIYEYVFDGTEWWALGAEGIYQLKADAEADHEELQEQIDALEENKQDNLGFEGIYNKETNKVVTKSAMTDAITSAVDALDKADSAVAHQFVTSVSEENGIITVLRDQPVIADIKQLPEEIARLDGRIDTKQDIVAFADDYAPETNKAATVATVTNAINALNSGDTAVEGEFVTSVSEAAGIITVARGQITTDHIQQGTKTFVLDCGSATF